jgi:hypothetical protein
VIAATSSGSVVSVALVTATDPDYGRRDSQGLARLG